MPLRSNATCSSNELGVVDPLPRSYKTLRHGTQQIQYQTSFLGCSSLEFPLRLGGWDDPQEIHWDCPPTGKQLVIRKSWPLAIENPKKWSWKRIFAESWFHNHRIFPIQWPISVYPSPFDDHFVVFNPPSNHMAFLSYTSSMVSTGPASVQGILCLSSLSMADRIDVAGKIRIQ